MLLTAAKRFGFSLPSDPARSTGDTLRLRNQDHELKLDARTGRLVSFRANSAPDQEFITGAEDDPVFVIQYIDLHKIFRQISSHQARSVKLSVSPGEPISMTTTYDDFEGFDLSATVSVKTVPGDAATYWSFWLRNDSGLMITDVQFPFVVVAYDLRGTPGTESILRPAGAGQLTTAPRPESLEPDSPHAWQFRPENGIHGHYPGNLFAQFLAYYNNRAGILLTCRDTSGAIKLMKAVHHGAGLRLGVAHVGDWPARGARKLEYDVTLQSFTGDWYDAAALYRDWSLKQHWAQTPLSKRKDVPAWLLDSPPHIIVRIQGQLDAGPAKPNTEFLPYPKIVPLLENISKRVEAPVLPVIMSWERPGPWIYPDSLPPAGGEQSLHEFTELARSRDWHIGTFCNGTNWIVGHYWSGYDGEDYFREHGGERCVCRTHTQENWKQLSNWRPGYPCCIGVPMTREIALQFVRALVRYGLDWIQFLDQNLGAAAFACFASDHGHPGTPGKWMTAGMKALLESFRAVNSEIRSSTAGKRQLVFSVEQPPNEYLLPFFQVCDVRVIPPGHFARGRPFIPLYHFLYHEFVLMQGGFGNAPEPYHMPIRNAYNLVVGEIPGGVLTGDGRLLNRDTSNWAPWEPQVGSNDDSIEMLRTTTALRRGKGRDFLVYGRMLRPPQPTNIKVVSWTNSGRVNQVPAVFHSAWQSPDGRIGLVFANWTKEIQHFQALDSRLRAEVLETVSSTQLKSRSLSVSGNRLELALPPLSCALVES